MTSEFRTFEEVQQFLEDYYSHAISGSYSNKELYQECLNNLCNRFLNAEKFCRENGFSFRELAHRISADIIKSGKKITTKKFYSNSENDVRSFFEWEYYNLPIRNFEIGSDEYKFIEDYHFIALMESIDFCFENGLSSNAISNEVYCQLEQKELQIRREEFRRRHPRLFINQAA